MGNQKKIILRPSMASEDVYKRVQKALTEAKVSHRDLCGAAKMSRMTLRDMKMGARETRLDSLSKLCKGLNKVGIPAELRLT